MPQLRATRDGLPQGFVRFGSTAHMMLCAMHEFGPMCHSEFVRELDLPKGVVSACIRRLLEADKRFLYWYGTIRIDDTTRVQDLWWLVPRGDKRAKDDKPFTHAELMNRYRKRKSLRVSSVWQFRPIVKRTKCQPTTK